MAALVPIHIDHLVQICGYFDSSAPVNNGYGCRHPEQEDQEEVYERPGVKCGRCFSFTCPLAAEMSPDEPEDAAIAAVHGLRPDFEEGKWLCIGVEELADLEAGRRDGMPEPLPLIRPNTGAEVSHG